MIFYKIKQKLKMLSLKKIKNKENKKLNPTTT